MVPSTSTWSGADSGSWADPGNWDTLPTTGSDLVFPEGASNLTNTDDLTSVTTYGSLTISGSGYTLNGTTNDSFTSIDSSQSSGTNTVNLPITLAGTGTVSVDTAGAELTLGGVISGSVGLTMNGPGTLDLTANNTYAGTTTVNSGTLSVGGLQGGSPVTVASGATLGGVGTVGSITATGATVAPGDNGVAGTMIDNGDLDLGTDSSSNNSTYSVVIDGSGTGGLQPDAGHRRDQLDRRDSQHHARAGFHPISPRLVYNHRQHGLLGRHRHVHAGVDDRGTLQRQQRDLRHQLRRRHERAILSS